MALITLITLITRITRITPITVYGEYTELIFWSVKKGLWEQGLLHSLFLSDDPSKNCKIALNRFKAEALAQVISII